jgi:hypothetical protein
MKQEEAAIQAAIVAHFRKTYEGVICHCPNGGKRGKLEAIRLKEMGVQAGHPDLLIYSPKGFFLMEVKEPKGTLSDSQKKLFPQLQNMGFDIATVFSVEEGKRALSEWKLPLKEPVRRSEVEARTGF